MQKAGRDQAGTDRVDAALNYGYGVLYDEELSARLHAETEWQGNRRKLSDIVTN